MSLKEAFGLPEVIVRERTLAYDGKPRFFRELTAARVRAIWSQAFDAEGNRVKGPKGEDLDYEILAEVVCDENGVPLGTASEWKEIPVTLKGEATRIALEVQGMGVQDQKDDKPKN